MPRGLQNTIREQSAATMWFKFVASSDNPCTVEEIVQ